MPNERIDLGYVQKRDIFIMLKLDTIHRNLHRISGSHSSTAKRWNRHSRERIALGAARYTGSCWACLKYLLLFPWFRADMTNRFARGTLALQDELGYRSSVIPA